MELTSRLKLRKPALTDPEEEEDFNYNYDILDNNPGWTVCTSVTRPTTNLFLRRMIYETDTKRIYAYSGIAGSEWIPVAPTPVASMTRAAGGAALPTGPSWTTLDMDQIRFDNYGGMCNIANNTFDILFPGWWYFSLYFTISYSYPGLMIASRIMRGPGNIMYAQTNTAVHNSAWRGQTTFCDCFIKLNKGDIVWGDGYNHYGAPATLMSTEFFIQLNAYYIGDQ